MYCTFVYCLLKDFFFFQKILDFRPEMTVDGLFLASAPLFKSILLNLGIHPESQDKLAISMRALKDAYGMFGQLLTTLLL